MNLDSFDHLLDAYLLGEISEEQSVQLRQALEADPAARARFVHGILIETHLHRLGRGEADALKPRPHTSRGTILHRLGSVFAINRPRRLALAAVLLAGVITTALFYLNRPPSLPTARVASGTVTVEGHPGDRIADGATLSVAGPAPAVIDLSDGSHATLEPSTVLTLHGRADGIRQVLQLVSGGGQFQVAQGGGQFRIDTPAGSVTVLGTQFTVSLQSPRNLFVSVAAGSVRFDGEGKSFTLSAGQSRTFGPEPDRPRPPVTPDNQIRDGWIESVDLEAGRFVLRHKKGDETESQTTFRIGSKTGEREAIILLDGKKSTFIAAMAPKRRASVTYSSIGNEYWVVKASVMSVAKSP